MSIGSGMSKYSERYFRPYSAVDLRIRRFVRDRLQLTPKVAWLFQKVRVLPKESRILDVGCGTGGFLQVMERANPDIQSFGIDLGYPSSFLSDGSFSRGSASQIPFADDGFDVVTCAHVVEHLQDPQACVRELVRVCRPGGFVYIETPSPRSAWFPFFNTFWDDPTHVRPYSRVGLKRLLNISGVDDVKSGVKRSWPAVLFGLPYLPIGVLSGDEQAKAMFGIYAFGFSVWAGGTKPTVL